MTALLRLQPLCPYGDKSAQFDGRIPKPNLSALKYKVRAAPLAERGWPCTVLRHHPVRDLYALPHQGKKSSICLPRTSYKGKNLPNPTSAKKRTRSSLS